MLKKRISESKKLGNLKSDSARLLYTWLIPFLDVEGRHLADPEIIKGHIFPKVKSMTIKKIERLLHELNEIDLIILYHANGEQNLQFTKFHELQKLIKGREASSDIPDPTQGSRVNRENSGVNHEKGITNKIKVNKEKVSKEKGQKEFDHLIKKEFSQFWDMYGLKIKKQDSFDAYKAVRKKFPTKEIARATHGYLDFLKAQRIEKNFKQEKMHPTTFLRKERWKDFINFKYKPRL